jgi:hypothetical protein
MGTYRRTFHSALFTAFAVLLLGTALMGLPTDATAKDMGRPTRKSVKFLQPQNTDQVKSPVTLKFEVVGMKIAPAGEPQEGTGHHHVIIDSAMIEEGGVIAADEKHLHYGKGQTEAVIELAPGEHKLTLQFADGLHRSYGAGMRQTIAIEVIP